jgi:hypothetical protein
MLPVSLDCVCFVFLRLVCSMLPVSQFFLFILSTSCVLSRETGNIGYTRRGQTKQTQSRETGSIGHTRRRKTKQEQSRETGNIGHTRRRQLPVSLDCVCFVCLRLVCPMLPVFLDCLCLFCLRLVCSMLPVSLDGACLVAHKT